MTPRATTVTQLSTPGAEMALGRNLARQFQNLAADEGFIIGL